MKQISGLVQFMFILGMCAYPASAPGAEISISEILEAVQNNTASLREQIVDFTSKEEITIEEFNVDKKGVIGTKKTTNIVSEFRAFPKAAKSGQVATVLPDILQKERTVLAVTENGKDRKNKNYTEPDFFAANDAYTDLFILFDKQNEQNFHYELKGIEKIGERDVYVIRIAQKEMETGQVGKWEYNIAFEGAARVDAETMEVVRLNRGRIYRIHYGTRSPRDPRINSVETGSYYLSQHEYGKVKIMDRFLTLPVARTIRLFRNDGSPDTVYKYRYSDFKAFTVDTKITYGSAGHRATGIDGQGEQIPVEKTD